MFSVGRTLFHRTIWTFQSEIIGGRSVKMIEGLRKQNNQKTHCIELYLQLTVGQFV